MGRKRDVKLKIEKFNNATFHMPWKYTSYYRCAYKKYCRDRFYCKCLRDNSVRKSFNCTTDCPYFKVRFKDKLRACWYILTKGFKFI